MSSSPYVVVFFNDPATTEIYTLSLHDALPICAVGRATGPQQERGVYRTTDGGAHWVRVLFADEKTDRKSTRLNSSHLGISYAVFCLKKKRKSTFSQPSLIFVRQRASLCV